MDEEAHAQRALAEAVSGEPPAISLAVSDADMTTAAAPSAGASSAEESTSAPEAFGAEDDCAGATQHGGAVFCPDCKMWVNGLSQWKDHYLFGKKHRMRIMRLAAQDDDPDDAVHVRFCEWQETVARMFNGF